MKIRVDWKKINEYENVELIYADGDHVLIHKEDGVYYIDQTIDKGEKILDYDGAIGVTVRDNLLLVKKMNLMLEMAMQKKNRNFITRRLLAMVLYQIEGRQEQEILKEMCLSSWANERNCKMLRVLSVIMVIVILPFTIVSFLYHYTVYGIFFGLLWLFFLGIMIKGGQYYQEKIWNFFNRKKNRLKSGMRQYQFDENGITITSKQGVEEHRWETFRSWNFVEKYICILNYRSERLVVKWRDLSHADLQELEALLTKHLQKENI